jgi:hypothetical protein
MLALLSLRIPLGITLPLMRFGRVEPYKIFLEQMAN